MFSLAERHCVEIDGKPVPISTLALVVFRHHQESERHFGGVVTRQYEATGLHPLRIVSRLAYTLRMSAGRVHGKTG
jgi:hypothetical protein